MIHVDTLQFSADSPELFASALSKALSVRDGRLHAVAGSCLNEHLKMAGHLLESASAMSPANDRTIVVIDSDMELNLLVHDFRDLHNTLFVFQEIRAEVDEPENAQSVFWVESLLKAGATVVALFHANSLEGVPRRLKQVGLGHRINALTIDLMVTRGDLQQEEAKAPRDKKTSELIWLDIEASFKEAQALDPVLESSAKIWLSRRQAILFPAFPVVVFLEAAGIPVSPEDLEDINRLDGLLAEGSRAHGELFQGVAQELQMVMLRLPGYSMDALGDQAETTVEHHGYMLMGARNLFGRSKQTVPA